MYPIIKPSLNIDFANVRRLDPRITFTNSSDGRAYFDEFGVMQKAAANVARFDHNPVTGESLGLLIEEQRTNLLTYSEQFDNDAWKKGSTVVTPNTEIAPDGTLTADTISGVTQDRPRQATAMVVGTTYCFSIYAKAGTSSWLRLRIGDYAAWFDLSTGALGTNYIGSPIAIETLPNGWYRCIGYRTYSGGTQYVQFSPVASNGSTPAAGTIHAWGAQLEPGTFPTSYIKTEASQKTRAADSAVMTGTNFSSWYNAVEGTLFASADTADVANSRVSAMIFDGTTSNRIHTNANQFAGFISAAGVTQLTIPVASVVRQNNVMSKTAIAFATNNGNAAANGTIGTLDTSLTVPVVNQVRLGGISVGNSNINGHIRRVAYYPRRLSDLELQALTT